MPISFRLLRIDFSIQAIFFLLNTAMLFTIPFEPIFLAYLLLAQVAIGLYQFFVSGLVHFFKDTFDPRVKTLRKYHLVFSASYILLLAGLLSFFSVNDRLLELFLLIVIPQLVAYAYFYLTWADYRGRRNYLEGRATIFAY